MKRSILSLFLLCICIAGHTQDNPVESEIMNYDYSKSDIISKARKLMLDKFTAGDMAKVREVKDYLLYQVEDADYAAFYPLELWLILYSTNDFAELIQNIQEADSLKMASFRNKIKPSPDQLFEKVRQKTRDNKLQLETEISNSGLMKTDKDFLILTLNYLISGQDYPEINQEKINNLSDDFLKNHPGSQYDEFTRQNIRYKFIPAKWGFAFEFFSGYGFLTDQLAEHFKNSIPFGVAFDVCYKDFSLYLRDYIGFSKTKLDIPYENGIWEKKSPVRIFLPEASLGYTAIENKYLKLSPFIGISSTDIGPTEYDIEKNKELEKAELEFTSTYSLGLNLDIKLGKSKMAMVTYGPEQSYWFLRLRYSYNMPQFDNKYEGFSGQFHSITVGIGGFGRKLKREI